MEDSSLVSVIIIFLNAEKFIQEAIESVIAQTYGDWELLLVDDGSTDASTEIARSYTAKDPQRARYLEHPGHQNQGMSTSRNLGIREAKGEYIAFLDADDIWLPYKLEQQIALITSYPEAGMIYGLDQYWYSWSGKPEDRHRDFVPRLGIQSTGLIRPPKLLSLFLRGKAAIPAPTGILIRRIILEEIGKFEDSFKGIYAVYEDQAFYAKLCLKIPVLVVDTCWDKYRQHPEASVAVSHRTGQEAAARQFYLEWLENYLNEHEITEVEVWQALRKELWLKRYLTWVPLPRRTQYLLRWIKKWLLRLEERVMPTIISQRLWGR